MPRKKVFIIFLAVVFLAHEPAAFAYMLAPEYLCEIGMKFYAQGRIADALHEFSKALVVSPGYEPALKYIDMIKRKAAFPAEPQPAPAPAVEPVSGRLPQPEPRVTVSGPGKIKAEKPETIKPAVKRQPVPKPDDRVRAKKALVESLEQAEKEYLAPPPAAPAAYTAGTEAAQTKYVIPPLLILDESIENLKFPLEIEKGKSIIVRGKNIQRFLVTSPGVLSVERSGQDDLIVTGKEIGYTYLHVWDERGRWTLEFLTVSPKPPGPTLEEEMRLAEEKAGTFKLRYTLDWSIFETGRRLDSLERSSYYWTHWLGLDGQTPYGNVDSSASIRVLQGRSNLSYITLGLTEGNIGPFKGFTLRGFDYWPGVVNLAFSGVNLRGAMLNSPAFNRKIDYTVFWGREGGGRYGGLSPGLVETRDSFVSGFDIDLLSLPNQNYSFSVFRGWGRDRPGNLNPFGYDFDADYHFDKWDLGYEIANDSDTFAHLLNLAYSVPKLKLTSELRNTDKDFKTMTGGGWRAGELGLLSALYYNPTEKTSISGRFDVFRDRLFPNPQALHRWNQDVYWDLNYAMGPLTNLRLDYTFQNELGKVLPVRYYSSGIGIYRTFEWFRRVSAYANYRYQQRKYPTSAASDYINDKVALGLRFNVIGDLYYFLSREFNWTQARFSGDRLQPFALETGLDWYSRVLTSPFWLNTRVIYRDEEDATSPLSFLAGEDYLEGYTELSYRPNPDIEGFLSARVRNVWADNPLVTKRIEVNFYAGMRYLWDTGIRWESVGTVEGFVFKDFNSDGLRQKDEPPAEGVKVWLGKDKTAVTDDFGHFNFEKVRAKKAFVNIDTSTIPAGFVLTVPATQEAAITHGEKAQINFGIVSRTDISGIIFVDVDGNGRFDPGDSGMRGVVLVLEDGSKVKTDDSGRYTFRKVAVGKHTLNLDLNSLPAIYLPAVPVFKDIEIFEGVSYIYNIPLRKIAK